MSLDIEELREGEPRWDEVRERRVLAKVTGERDARRERRVRNRRAAVVGAVSIAATLLLVLAVQRWSGEEHIATAPEVSAPAAPMGDPAGRLALSDGSEIELTLGARVEVEQASPTEIVVSQRDGAARYVVSHLPSRRFVVRCSGVEVEVRGTRFWVRHQPDAVEVDVEEGRVAVRRGDAESLLAAGESLRVRLTDEPVSATPATTSETTPSTTAMVVPEATHRPVTVASVPSRPPVARETPVAPAPRDVAALLDAAEQARREHRFDDAVAALEEAVAQLRGEPRAATAYFTLGRLERTRARHGAAAAAFESAYDADPEAILAEDALAEAVVSWSVAGRLDRARALGLRYVERFPEGAYEPRVRAAIED